MMMTPSSLGWGRAAILLAFAVLILVPGINNLPVTDRDEGRFVQASKQMIERGDYLDIRFQDEARHKKPVGIYWLQTAFVQLAQTLPHPPAINTIWPYRLPSLLGALLAVLITAWGGAKLAGQRVGMLAGALLLGSLVLQVEARIAKTDAMLLATTTFCMIVLARAYTHQISHRLAALFWLAAGLSILLKGPLLLLLAGGAIGMLAITDRRIGWLRQLRPATGVPLLLLVTLPWFIAIYIVSDGAFYREAVGHDLLGKIWQGQDRGFVPPGVHTLLLPVLLWPATLWLALALPVLKQSWTQPLIRFLIAWIVPFWIVMEISLTKLAHYTLPAYPALALLAAVVIVNGWHRAGAAHWAGRWAARVWWGIAVILACALAVLPWSLQQPFVPTALGAGILLVAAATWALRLYTTQAVRAAFIASGGMMIFAMLNLAVTLPALRPLWLSQAVVNMVPTDPQCSRIRFVTAGYNEPSLVFLAGTNTIFAHDGASAAQALRQTPCAIAMIRDHQREAFLHIAGGQATTIGQIHGFHYNGGGWQDFDLLRWRP